MQTVSHGITASDGKQSRRQGSKRHSKKAKNAHFAWLSRSLAFLASSFVTIPAGLALPKWMGLGQGAGSLPYEGRGEVLWDLWPGLSHSCSPCCCCQLINSKVPDVFNLGGNAFPPSDPTEDIIYPIILWSTKTYVSVNPLFYICFLLTWVAY